MESYLYPGDQSHGQALVHLDDLMLCIRKVIEKRHELDEEELFLIAEPDAMSYGELQDEIGMLLHGKEWPTIRIPKFVAKAGAYVQNAFAGEEDQPFIKPWMIDLADDQYLVDIERARTKLDWHPQHRLRQTLPKMIDFLRRDPKAFYTRHKLPMPESLMAKS
jgi:nucleoside-diphosphate-sugar epimerase